MYPLYKDIRTKLGEPVWIDQHGVPRYEPFHPELLGIYDKWALEIEVKCQSCHQLFLCAAGSDEYEFNPATKSMNHFKTVDDAINRLSGWGDAPWHTHKGDQDKFDGQCAGTTMCSDSREIRLWRRDHQNGWMIVQEIDGQFEDEE